MSTFIRKLIIFIVLFCVISFVPAYTIDPYNVFHWDCARSNGVEPNKNYIKTRFLLKYPDKYNALVFGSSRVGSIHVDKIDGLKVYNMTYSAGVPEEHLQNIKTLKNGGVKLKRIYIGVDAVLLNDSVGKHHTYLRCSYEYLKANPDMFVRLYCNPLMLWQSVRTGKNILNDSTIAQLYRNGWDVDYGYKSKWDSVKEHDVKRVPSQTMSPYVRDNMNTSLNAIKEIVGLCALDNIELVVFTNPMYKTTHIRALNDGYLEFLRQLVEITPFYNFSGLNDITVDANNYRDSSHYNAETSDMLINVMVKKVKYPALYEQGFGWYVDKTNIDLLMNKLDNV